MAPKQATMSQSVAVRRRLIYAGCDMFYSVMLQLLRRSDIEIVLCLTGHDDFRVRNVQRAAAEHGIPIHFGKPDTVVIQTIMDSSADSILCAAYPYRFPVTRIGLTYNLNLHPTLLPHGRGPDPLPYLVSGNACLAGLTIHEMTDEFDAGPIILQQPIEMEPSWGSDELAMALYVRAPDVVMRLFDDLECLFAARIPQQAGSYWPMLPKAERIIDWSEGIQHIAEKNRKYRSGSLFCRIDGCERRITAPIKYIALNHAMPSGQTLFVGQGFRYITAAGGVVRVQLAQVNKGWTSYDGAVSELLMGGLT